VGHCNLETDKNFKTKYNLLRAGTKCIYAKHALTSSECRKR